MICKMTITTAKALLFAVLLAATTRSSHAFQLAQKNSPLLLHATNNRKIFASPANHNNLNLLDLHQSSSSATTLGRSAAITTMLHASSNINTDDDDTKDITDLEKANTTVESNKNLASSTKQFLSTHFLSLAIFLLPLFLFANDAWAVQSGGRMGGSFSGSSSGSSSRTYSAPSSGSYGSGYSRGYNRGYSSGYYSRPSVVVSPGISPFYR